MKKRTHNRHHTASNFIELPIDIIRNLASRAEALGVSVKRLIEQMIINSVDSVPGDDDEAFYAYLLSTPGK